MFHSAKSFDLLGPDLHHTVSATSNGALATDRRQALDHGFFGGLAAKTRPDARMSKRALRRAISREDNSTGWTATTNIG